MGDGPAAAASFCHSCSEKAAEHLASRRDGWCEPAVSPLPCFRSFRSEAPPASVAEADMVFLCTSELRAF